MTENLRWPVDCTPTLEIQGHSHNQSFKNESMLARKDRLLSCLVGRVVGDNPSPVALRQLGKVWRVGGEL